MYLDPVDCAHSNSFQYFGRTTNAIVIVDTCLFNGFQGDKKTQSVCTFTLDRRQIDMVEYHTFHFSDLIHSQSSLVNGKSKVFGQEKKKCALNNGSEPLRPLCWIHLLLMGLSCSLSTRHACKMLSISFLAHDSCSKCTEMKVIQFSFLVPFTRHTTDPKIKQKKSRARFHLYSLYNEEREKQKKRVAPQKWSY